MVVLKSSTNSLLSSQMVEQQMLLPCQLVEQANAQLQRILAEHNPGEELHEELSTKKMSPISPTESLYNTIPPTNSTSTITQFNKVLSAASPSPSIRQLPDSRKEWEENLQVE